MGNPVIQEIRRSLLVYPDPQNSNKGIDFKYLEFKKLSMISSFSINLIIFSYKLFFFRASLIHSDLMNNLT